MVPIKSVSHRAYNFTVSCVPLFFALVLFNIFFLPIFLCFPFPFSPLCSTYRSTCSYLSTYQYNYHFLLSTFPSFFPFLLSSFFSVLSSRISVFFFPSAFHYVSLFLSNSFLTFFLLSTYWNVSHSVRFSGDVSFLYTAYVSEIGKCGYPADDQSSMNLHCTVLLPEHHKCSSLTVHQ